ncbi:sugar nucleotide-binding protein [Candidatus Berkiella aquae]|uniref:RmlD substrate binding domain protein n=1 Tax=Candidatus Berkiella aquae TaxID=295108 RepID=A0A0Q9YWU3_9GAMM|nr:sugar nucleotide-binding protein [Candidatus Berkiella aquae]MCS5710958.1 sugar nucleotide-binding protein [Candidatus Berkiella aquae]
MQRILIVGCGYVGKMLATQYLQSGASVYALQRHSVNLPGIHNLLGDVTKISLRDLAPFDRIFYLVSADNASNEAYQHAYVAGVSHLLKQVPTHPGTRMLYISSTAVYGQNQGEWVDENTITKPLHFSGQCLLEGEQKVQESGLDHVIVRFAGIYGPHRTQLLDKICQGHATLTPIPCYTNRIHVNDCVGSLYYLANHPACPSLILGVDSTPTLYNDMLLWLAKQFNAPTPIMGSDIPSRLQNSNKRCSNQRLLGLGYPLQFPSYQEGYQLTSIF